jgi:hypothetical protein
MIRDLRATLAAAARRPSWDGPATETIVHPLLDIAAFAFAFGLATYGALVCHELRHAVAARLLGLRAWLVQVGSGPSVELRIRGIRVQAGAVPLGGRTVVGSGLPHWLPVVERTLDAGPTAPGAP